MKKMKKCRAIKRDDPIPTSIVVDVQLLLRTEFDSSLYVV